jgi:hypothetical protein
MKHTAYKWATEHNNLWTVSEIAKLYSAENDNKKV